MIVLESGHACVVFYHVARIGLMMKNVVAVAAVHHVLKNVSLAHLALAFEHAMVVSCHVSHVTTWLLTMIRKYLLLRTCPRGLVDFIKHQLCMILCTLIFIFY